MKSAKEKNFKNSFISENEGSQSNETSLFIKQRVKNESVPHSSCVDRIERKYPQSHDFFEDF